MQPIDICFITDKNYIFATEIAIGSIVKNKNRNTQLNIYIFTDFDYKKNIEYDSNVHIETFKIEKECFGIFSHNFKHRHVSCFALCKIFLASIFDKKDTILYIDSDVIVMKDLSELFYTDISNVFCAAVEDLIATHTDKHHIRLGKRSYFNSGMMLLNLKKMRLQNMEELMVETKLSEKESPFMDQDVFNRCFGDNIIYLPLKYNFMLTLLTNHKAKAFISEEKLNKLESEAVIMHFTNKDKPWKNWKSPLFNLYFKSLCLYDKLRLIKHVIYEQFNQLF